MLLAKACFWILLLLVSLGTPRAFPDKLLFTTHATWLAQGLILSVAKSPLCRCLETLYCFCRASRPVAAGATPRR